jgi:hypothetical protein
MKFIEEVNFVGGPAGLDFLLVVRWVEMEICMLSVISDAYRLFLKIDVMNNT